MENLIGHSPQISEKNCALHAEWNAQLAILWVSYFTHYYPQNDWSIENDAVECCEEDAVTGLVVMPCHIVWQLLFLCTLTAKTARKAPRTVKLIWCIASQLGIWNAGSNVPMVNGNWEKKPLNEKLIAEGRGNTVNKNYCRHRSVDQSMAEAAQHQPCPQAKENGRDQGQ